jgi:type I restriction enzyme R subunit
MDKIRLNELQYVEEPFLRQLERLGWHIYRGDKYEPVASLREGFNEFIIDRQFRESIKAINTWIEDDQIDEVVRQITIPQGNSLIPANQEMLQLLLENTSVSENRKTGEHSPTVHFIDYENPDNNSFIAISQFKLTIPGTENHIIPDIVLFVNGLPLVVVECKSPHIADPIGEAVIQLQRYSNQRDAREGNEKLFWHNQICIATSRQQCRYSSITGQREHFLEWKDPYPFGLSEIETDGSEVVSSQHILIQGMLNKQSLLDIIRHFVVFQENDKGKNIKIIPRYQQYRTVRKIVTRLKSGKTSTTKGGIVWHTQGSGKSLTMMFAVRKMYRDPELAKYKVVFITDRTNLEKQLRNTAKSVGYTVNVANRISKLKELLASTTPDLVMGMIHKFQEREMQQEFPVLNESPNILVMVDEAHRSQYKFLGANLLKSLPNATRIAFTGTPVDKTEKTFGDYIDKYTIRQAVDDEQTVEIIYEGRTHEGEISDRDAMSKRFEDVFAQVDETTREEIIGRYAWGAYLESEKVIKDKASDMVDHYVSHIFPNRFKAQVVAVSRRAAVTYKAALEDAIVNKISQMKKQGASPEDIALLSRFKVAVVISGSANDPPEWHSFIDEGEHDKAIASFKLPFGETSEDGIAGDVGILVVRSMLITGFDAPIEQVMYLDNVIKEHNLLQAIARVNRVDQNKTKGYVVDYVGVARHLREALGAFDAKDVEEMLEVIKDESADIDNLKYSHSQLKDFFNKYDVNDTNDVDAAIDVLVDEDVRSEFCSLFRDFSRAMDRVLPDVEALKYVGSLKALSFISISARNRYRDDKLNLKDASRKIREIIDEFLITKGVDPKIPPLPIFSEQFKVRLQHQKTEKAKAEELKHAIEEHIQQCADEDPELYERFAEKLAKLLEEYKNNWEALAKELEQLVKEIEEGRSGQQTFGFHARTEMPFMALLRREVFDGKEFSDLSDEQLNHLVETTKDLLGNIRKEIAMVDFWENYTKQKRLKSFIVSHLLENFKHDKAVMNNRNAIAQKIMELASHLDKKLIETNA